MSQARYLQRKVYVVSIILCGEVELTTIMVVTGVTLMRGAKK